MKKKKKKKTKKPPQTEILEAPLGQHFFFLKKPLQPNNGFQNSSPLFLSSHHKRACVCIFFSFLLVCVGLLSHCHPASAKRRGRRRKKWTWLVHSSQSQREATGLRSKVRAAHLDISKAPSPPRPPFYGWTNNSSFPKTLNSVIISYILTYIPHTISHRVPAMTNG